MQASIVAHTHPPAGPETAEMRDIQALEQSRHVGQGMVAARTQLVAEAWPGEADTAGSDQVGRCGACRLMGLTDAPSAARQFPDETLPHPPGRRHIQSPSPQSLGLSPRPCTPGNCPAAHPP